MTGGTLLPRGSQTLGEFHMEELELHMLTCLPYSLPLWRSLHLHPAPPGGGQVWL